jgi:mannose-6-phosphate isomerase-like protein (cupin superfamily)/rubrerythrin
MFFTQNLYAYPYENGFQSFKYAYINRNQDGNFHEVIDALLRGIKREADLSELYRQLAYHAPDQQHRTDLFHAVERKKVQINQLSYLYAQLTGTYPVYQLDPIPFTSYLEGLRKAYEGEEQGYEEYMRGFSTIQHPLIQQFFLWFLNGEQENATRFRILCEEASDRYTDYGGRPFVVDINKATKQNHTFRRALWTGSYLQVTLMSINVGEEIGLENHPNLDQFLRIEEGQGLVQMGKHKERLDFQNEVSDDFAIMIPANTWHNVINTGNTPLKLYSIYAPPQHPVGTVHETKADAIAAETN